MLEFDLSDLTRNITATVSAKVPRNEIWSLGISTTNNSMKRINDCYNYLCLLGCGISWLHCWLWRDNSFCQLALIPTVHLTMWTFYFYFIVLKKVLFLGLFQLVSILDMNNSIIKSIFSAKINDTTNCSKSNVLIFCIW